MVFSLIIHEPVGIVDPVYCRRKVELRAIRLLVGRDALSKGVLAESQGQYNGCRSQKRGPLRQRSSPPLRGEQTDLLFHVLGVIVWRTRAFASALLCQNRFINSSPCLAFETGDKGCRPNLVQASGICTKIGVRLILQNARPQFRKKKRSNPAIRRSFHASALSSAARRRDSERSFS